MTTTDHSLTLFSQLVYDRIQSNPKAVLLVLDCTIAGHHLIGQETWNNLPAELLESVHFVLLVCPWEKLCFDLLVEATKPRKQMFTFVEHEGTKVEQCGWQLGEKYGDKQQQMKAPKDSD